MKHSVKSKYQYYHIKCLGNGYTYAYFSTSPIKAVKKAVEMHSSSLSKNQYCEYQKLESNLIEVTVKNIDINVPSYSIKWHVL